MKKQFLVLGLDEPSLVQNVSLSSSGISTEEEMIVVGHHLRMFDNELTAIKWIEAEQVCANHEHGVEIRQVWVQKSKEVVD